MKLFPYQVEVKRTVPREDMEVKGVPKTKKIFVGGIPASLTDGNCSPTNHFDFSMTKVNTLIRKKYEVFI